MGNLAERERMRTSQVGIRRSPFGFTLIELLVVMAILGILIAMSSFGLSGFMERRKNRMFLRQFEHLLRLARVRAISTGQTAYVIVNPETRTVIVDGTDKFISIPEDITVESKGIRWEESEKGLQFPFYPDGSSGGGTIFIRWGDREWDIRINPVTGFLKVEASRY